jgi:hypothetical protein
MFQQEINDNEEPILLQGLNRLLSYYATQSLILIASDLQPTWIELRSIPTRIKP